MTTASDLRDRARAVLIGEGQGIVITLQNPAPASGSTYDPTTGSNTAGGAGALPALLTGFGRVARFSDALAAGGLIENGDRKVVFYPDLVPGTPMAEGILTITNADGSTETLRAIACTTRELGGEVEHHVIQARR